MHVIVINDKWKIYWTTKEHPTEHAGQNTNTYPKMLVNYWLAIGISNIYKQNMHRPLIIHLIIHTRVVYDCFQLKVVIDSNAKLTAYEKGADFTLVSVVEAVGDTLTVVSDVLCQRSSCFINLSVFSSLTYYWNAQMLLLTKYFIYTGKTKNHPVLKINKMLIKCWTLSSCRGQIGYILIY